MTRVLQVSRSVIDGGFDYHAEIARAFQDRGAEVITVFQRGLLDGSRERKFPGRVICLDAGKRRRYKKVPVLTFSLWRLCGGTAVDLAICHHLTPTRAVDPLLSLNRVKKACMIVHDFDYFDPDDAEGRKRGRYLRRVLRRPWTVIGVSDAICANVCRQVPELRRPRCQTIPNAIDMEGLLHRAESRGAARQALGLGPEEFVLGTVGRLVAFKAHHDLIAGFASVATQMPDARLIIIGRGPLEDALRGQVKSLGLSERILIRGFVDDAARHMRALDLFVLPSRNEPFGLVLLEAMACGVPVIASDSGAPPEILPLESQLFPTGDAAVIGERILSLYSGGDGARRRLGEAGYQRAMHDFTLPRYRDAYAALLDAPDMKAA